MIATLPQYIEAGTDYLDGDTIYYVGTLIGINALRYETELTIKNPTTGDVTKYTVAKDWVSEHQAEIGHHVVFKTNGVEISLIAVYNDKTLKSFYKPHIVIKKATAKLAFPDLGMATNYVNLRKFSGKIDVDHYVIKPKDEVDVFKDHPEYDHHDTFVLVSVSGTDEQMTTLNRFLANENYFKDFTIILRR